MDDKTKLTAIADKLLIGQYHRHVFLCIGEDCCTKQAGEAAWEALKRELKDHNLSLSTGPNACYRTKVQCLRVCCNGPILVVYPEGTYYYGMTADKIPEFVQKHLIENQPLEDWVFARNPLPLVEEK
jgi:(2Fe-2S) ferredoxin